MCQKSVPIYFCIRCWKCTSLWSVWLSVRVCLRDVTSGLHPQSQPHPLQNRPQPGVRSQADPRQLFLHNLWITVTLSVPGGHLLPLENDIVSVTAPTTSGTKKTSSHSDGPRGKVWHVMFCTVPPSRPACTRTCTLSPLWRRWGWDPWCVFLCSMLECITGTFIVLPVYLPIYIKCFIKSRSGVRRMIGVLRLLTVGTNCILG